MRALAIGALRSGSLNGLVGEGEVFPEDLLHIGEASVAEVVDEGFPFDIGLHLSLGSSPGTSGISPGRPSVEDERVIGLGINDGADRARGSWPTMDGDHLADARLDELEHPLREKPREDLAELLAQHRRTVEDVLADDESDGSLPDSRAWSLALGQRRHDGPQVVLAHPPTPAVGQRDLGRRRLRIPGV